MSIFRNTPCPCGSGKKYKKCCHGKELPQAANRQETAKAAQSRLISQLVNFANSKKMARHVIRAFNEFYPDARSKPKEFFTKDKETAFMGWFVFNHRLDKGKRVIELFAKKEESKLDPAVRSLLREWLPTSPGICEVTEIDQGRGVLLQNIITEEKVFAHEAAIAEQAKERMILLVHLVPVGEENHFASYVVPFKAEEKDELITLANEEYDKYTADRPDAGWNEFFNDRVTVFLQRNFEKEVKLEETATTEE